MKEEELFQKIDETSKEIDRLLSNKDLEGLYNLCHCPEYKLYRSEDELMDRMYILSEVIRSEASYREKTVADLIDESSAIRPSDQLNRIFDEVMIALLRIDNDLDDDFVIDGLQTLAESDISGDMMIAVSKVKTRDSGKVLKYIAEAFKEVNPFTSLKILKYVVEENAK